MRTKDPIREVAERLEADLAERLERSGLMHRLFMRVKTMRSIAHKMRMKGERYRQGTVRMQDIIGLRVVLYFPEDVDILAFYLSCQGLVKQSIDEPDISTFRPRRLNLTKRIPEADIEAFREGLPPEYAPFIDETYEIQIRTIFSEGWHEVEHDLRYKCQGDWIGCESYSRTLNGLFATLETAEWGMQALFREMAGKNRVDGNYGAMLRNMMRIRLKSDDFSPAVSDYLKTHPLVAERLMAADRMVLMLTILNHEGSIRLDHDNVLFLVNRIELKDKGVRALEHVEVSRRLDEFLRS